MTQLIVLLVATLFSVSSFAVDPNKADFSKINLVGLRVLDQDQQDNFQYHIRVNWAPSSDVVTDLEKVSASKIASPLFELDEQSSFKNIYVFIGKKDDGSFVFIETFVNAHSMFVVEMAILNVEKSYLDLTHGPDNNLVYYTADSVRGDLFP